MREASYIERTTAIRIDQYQWSVAFEFECILTVGSGVCGVTDQRFPNREEMYEFFSTKFFLF